MKYFVLLISICITSGIVALSNGYIVEAPIAIAIAKKSSGSMYEATVSCRVKGLDVGNTQRSTQRAANFINNKIKATVFFKNKPIPAKAKAENGMVYIYAKIKSHQLTAHNITCSLRGKGGSDQGSGSVLLMTAADFMNLSRQADKSSRYLSDRR